MGLFWNLIQQSQISEQNKSTATLEQRVFYLEQELVKTQKLLGDTLSVLEEHTGKDIDKDGRVG